MKLNFVCVPCRAVMIAKCIWHMKSICGVSNAKCVRFVNDTTHTYKNALNRRNVNVNICCYLLKLEGIEHKIDC